MAGSLVVQLLLPPPPSCNPPSLQPSPPSPSPTRPSSAHSSASHNGSLSSGCNGHCCLSSDADTILRRIRVIMGPCRWKYCGCPQGNCVTDTPGQVEHCDECAHPMAYHEEYTTREPTAILAPPVPMKFPPAQIFNIPDINLPVAERTELVMEIFERLENFAIVRINGTPASDHKLIYVLIGWAPDKVESVGGWAKYLEEQTGVNGFNWISHPGYLFIDEAQQTYGDQQVWTGLFKAVSSTSRCRVVLFTSYGSPNKGSEGFFVPRFRQTPMTFDPAQQISLNPDHTVIPDFKPVGLLLNEYESMKLVGHFMKDRLSSIFTGDITEDFKRGVWQVSQGHVGLIISFCEVLGRLQKLRPYRHSDLHWQTICDVVFKEPAWLFERIKGSQFARGLPSCDVLQEPAVARVLKEAVLSPRGLIKLSYVEGTPEHQALYYIWRNGWLHAQAIGTNIEYVFPTDFHKWFCACVFNPADSETQPLPYQSPLHLAIEVVKRFNPHQLSEPKRAFNRDTSPLEDQYGKEFYRCIDEILRGRMLVSPEFAIDYGNQSGSLDFYISDMNWGIELLRDNDRISEHLNRFEPGGQYHRLVQENNMNQWIVLNFTNRRPSKKRTGHCGRLYHVVFTNNFRSFEILHADLELESAFSLLENHSHLFLS
ncbi:hypothetical protein BO71DRAFT_184152 [Aspergillus ellipticus CBS 707.79]|uniref:Uncharacterized protein n=1 Tax=Aspergillus ellipticus CBS 707.79 TaxID=1448320 RepID=A0A319DFP6_9EURO|nr:hypothetical protein BO71DRAFT_184152 [Aspergillus ellipticus CBS 707.79]